MFLKSIIFKFIFFTSIILLGVIFLPFLISKGLTFKVVRLWANIIIFALRKILNIKIRFDYSYIKKKSGAIIAANHKSAFDTIYFLTAFDKVIYVVKEELKYLPVYGWYATRLGNIFINRKRKIESMRKLSKSLEKYIKNGYKVIIFPEGTRQPANRIGDIKPGIFFIQSILKEPIYPIFINSGNVWPKDSLFMKKEDILLKSLKPIKYGLNKDDFKKKLKKAYEQCNYEKKSSELR